jgi:hypothetical protein
MSIQNICTDLIHNMMEYMDISELNTANLVCKNFMNDANTYVANIKKETNMKTMTDKYTCRNCCYSSYEVDKQFCTDCFQYKCDNCYAVRNSMCEFVKYISQNNEGVREMRLMCCDYCMYRCHKCKYVDVHHQLFLNNDDEMQTICVDCFVDLNDEEKNKYKSVHNNDEWDDLDALD